MSYIYTVWMNPPLIICKYAAHREPLLNNIWEMFYPPRPTTLLNVLGLHCVPIVFPHYRVHGNRGKDRYYLVITIVVVESPIELFGIFRYHRSIPKIYIHQCFQTCSLRRKVN